MADQAESLRQLVLRSQLEPRSRRRGSLLLVFGAEPGVGASRLSLQLALGWRRLDRSAALVELRRHRPPLASSENSATLIDVLRHERTLREAWSAGLCGLPTIVGDLQDDPLHSDDALVQQLRLAATHQRLLLDVQDLSDLSILLPLADHCLFVTTADADRVQVIYGVIKQAAAHLQGATRCWLVMNRVSDVAEALAIQRRLVLTCDRCLNLALSPLGCFPAEPDALDSRKHAMSLATDRTTPAGRQAVNQFLARIDAVDSRRQSH